MMHTAHRGPGRRVRPGRGAAIFAALVLALPTAARAQSPRVQGAWVDDHVAGALFGVDFRRPLGGAQPIPGPDSSGPLVASTRNWIFTGMAGVGANFAPWDGGTDALVYAHLGVLYRTGSDLLPRVGLVAADYLVAHAVGPQLVVEVEGVIDAQAGAFHTPEGWRAGASLNVALRFLKDILGGS